GHGRGFIGVGPLPVEGREDQSLLLVFLGAPDDPRGGPRDTSRGITGHARERLRAEGPFSQDPDPGPSLGSEPDAGLIPRHFRHVGLASEEPRDVAGRGATLQPCERLIAECIPALQDRDGNFREGARITANLALQRTLRARCRPRWRIRAARNGRYSEEERRDLQRTHGELPDRNTVASSEATVQTAMPQVGCFPGFRTASERSHSPCPCASLWPALGGPRRLSAGRRLSAALAPSHPATVLR